ncbi:MAG: hypothetical protein M1401_11035 [Chloroflexi bacterium]|nr:hypothetical protein [Chloroflexota bacterium]
MPENNFARIDASVEEDYKCSRCGSIFDKDGQDEAQCPVCGNVCTPQTCRVLNASKEGF